MSLQQSKVWSPIRGLRVRTSVWLWIAIACLVLANVLFTVAFLTNGWGILYVAQNTKPVPQPPTEHQVNVSTSSNSAAKSRSPSELDSIFTVNTASGGDLDLFTENERYWKFGLWECCRNDGFCLGTRWPGLSYYFVRTRKYAM